MSLFFIECDDLFFESLQCLREHLWGKEVINYVQEADKIYAIVDLTLFSNLLLKLPSNNILLIHQEYILAYDAILKKIESRKRAEESESATAAFLITGQLGIGTSRRTISWGLKNQLI